MLKIDWPVPENVGIAMTNRHGGFSLSPFNSLNLGEHVGDNKKKVVVNRQVLVTKLNLPAEPHWLNQVHGTEVIDLSLSDTIVADGSYTNELGKVCAVMTADCLPVLLCDKAGTQVSALHAGWRGLCNGVIENGVSKFDCSSQELIAYLGPAIGPKAFEVGTEVMEAFCEVDEKAMSCFTAADDKYLANICGLAIQRIKKLGVTKIFSCNHCTYNNVDYFSYRRDKITGRQASLIWLKK
ncbi:peptidoglycan editing factor PgeF [Parashewanella spongiae]|uniref:Purine nucleoside phosphorylase n=1 Tax=Parashewanella spongiae TaxID=342950 RepID=A0A3A6TX35_9GAMM|nr:peptidoglycan editing factor PgeF [Parashewanella spongiae]MCL1078134.1 peptidoglycan editing factor PgeF [Parashewanella spongiae]RJY16380.1 peptidoglycan editing factor PgeF [Parashewanella spongiae]